ncbi:MAG: hypothetical protein ACK47B_26500 [Armatimonadota bacterium]
MTAIPHLLTGAALGARIRNPVVALPLAVASHLLLDAIPHADAAVLAGSPSPGYNGAEILISVGSFVVGLGLVLWCAWGDRRFGWIVLAALAGMLIDFVFVLPWWKQFFQSWPPTAWLSQVHLAASTPAHRYPLLVGITTQLLVSLAAFWVLRRSTHPAPARVRRQGLTRGIE